MGKVLVFKSNAISPDFTDTRDTFHFSSAKKNKKTSRVLPADSELKSVGIVGFAAFFFTLNSAVGSLSSKRRTDQPLLCVSLHMSRPQNRQTFDSNK